MKAKNHGFDKIRATCQSTPMVDWITSPGLVDYETACAEMEGAAVAQVCAKAGVPFVVIRSISDTADHDARVDYRSFFPQVAEHAGAVVRGPFTSSRTASVASGNPRAIRARRRGVA